MAELIFRGPVTDEGRAAVQVLHAIWPMVGHLWSAPPWIQAVPKVVMSVRLWNALRGMRFEGVNPVDPVGRKLYGFDVEPISGRPLNYVEIVIPIGIWEGSSCG